MPVLTIRTEDAEATELLLRLARRLGLEVETSAPVVTEAPPKSWSGLISKESAQLLLDEVAEMRKNEWDRQF